MVFSIWDNAISKRFSKQKKPLESLLFKIMNLTGKISLLFLILAFVQVIFVFDVIAANLFLILGNPMLLVDIVPQGLILCFLASSFVFTIFSIACAIVAYLRKEYYWAVGIIIVNLLSVPYLWIRKKEFT